ncbi:shikimate kinase [Salinimicrobium sp. MT39]|uniref:Shikimate kinase n=1 Tax=Salinimicrobium profundisediminis TaxID=2994553 RepID=A0A9X3CZU4_9FLAO|nr:shikimate kinase [Salinimicrobium profundisediminis]MCX2838674.1 shikimate kinase [Salinimicrobium profundisediminis]
MKIILIGYMGSGKSSVGKALATHLSVKFLDLDAKICAEENKTIPEIFSTNGEIYFRRKEAEVLKKLLEREESYVLSLGGGTPCYGKNMQLIKNTASVTSIYLKTGLLQLKERLIVEKDSRPLIQDLKTPEVLEDYIRKHLFERTFYYNQSDLTVLTDSKSVEEVVHKVVESLD